MNRKVQSLSTSLKNAARRKVARSRPQQRRSNDSQVLPCDTLRDDVLTIPIDNTPTEALTVNEDQPADARLRLPPYETVALVLQGGGALGAYQAGVYQGLHEAGIEPTWLAGISIGALNTAIIAGNPPETRVERLTDFWETICQPNFGVALPPFVEQSLFNINDTVRQSLSAWHAASALMNGQKGFFAPRIPPPQQILPGDSHTASYYDTAMLKDTLERLCDFDRINSGEHHVSVGAVNVRTGNFVYFDNHKIKLRAEHFMASGALPPAFAPVEIDGEHYWDGGLVSNTPLAHVLEARPMRDTLVFQVDLWSARGVVPTNMSEVSDRIKDIQYSSRTRLITDQLRFAQNMRHMLRRILDDIPPELLVNDQFYRLVQDLSCGKRYNVIHLIYRNKPYEQHYKDYQFGLAAMREHWEGGLADIRETFTEPQRLAMPDNISGFVTHDVHGEEIERLMQGYSAPVLNHSS
jgi:NTE family protein